MSAGDCADFQLPNLPTGAASSRLRVLFEKFHDERGCFAGVGVRAGVDERHYFRAGF
jgi:hypothetical protein